MRYGQMPDVVNDGTEVIVNSEHELGVKRLEVTH